MDDQRLMDQIYATVERGKALAVGAIARRATSFPDADRTLRHHHHRQRRGRRHDRPCAGARPRRASSSSSAATSCPRKRRTGTRRRCGSTCATGSRERWLDRRGREFQPYTHYCVGGNTKFWGSVLYRLRREDFQAVAARRRPVAGVADHLRHARAVLRAGRMPLSGARPARSRSDRTVAAPVPARRRAARRRHGRRSSSSLRGLGLHPSPLPLGLLRPGAQDGCQLCNTCNSFPCKVHAKSDADVCCIRPLLQQPTVTLWTNALARRLMTDAAGRKVEAVEVERNGERSARRGAGRHRRPAAR